jgi:Zn-dependent protease with chaperone function
MTVDPNALCFGAEFPATGAPCRVEVSSHGLTLHVEGCSPQSDGATVPFSSLTVSAGGLDHDQLVVKWGKEPATRTLYVKDPVLIRTFREAAPPELTHHFETAAAKVRQARTHRRRMWGIVIGSLGALALFLWLGSDWLVELAVSRIPVEWEQKLGESAYRDFLAQQDVLKEGPAVAAVNEMTQRLTSQATNNPYTFDVTVVRSDVINAFALPGGYIVVFTGLMKKAESGEEVAGVLSHEVNHVLQRHGLDRIVKTLGLMAVVTILVGDPQGLAGLMKQVGLELVTLKFGRVQETEADLTGLQLLQRAKIDPTGMVRFFERLSEKDQGRMEWLSTHPMSTARAERLKAELASLPKTIPEPFTFDWKKIQESLGVQPVATP